MLDINSKAILFDNIFSQSQDAIILVNNHGAIVDCNNGTYSLYELPESFSMNDMSLFELQYIYIAPTVKSAIDFDNLKMTFQAYFDQLLICKVPKYDSFSIYFPDKRKKSISSIAFPVILENKSYMLLILKQTNSEFTDLLDFEEKPVSRDDASKKNIDVKEPPSRQSELFQLNMELEKRVKSRTEQLERTMFLLEEEIAKKRSIERELIISKNDMMNAYTKEKEHSQLKSRFISMISHEYRTPLTVLLSSSYLLEKAMNQNDRSTASKHFERINTSVKQMTNLLDNVLMSERLESEERIVDTRTFDIQFLINQLIDEHKVRDKYNHKVDFFNFLPDSMISSDQTLVNTIVSNLLSNAINYSPKGSIIEIKVSENDEELMIKIKNQGESISEKDKKYLFSPFYRGSNKENTKGTGLGLSMVRRSVELLNGTITYDSHEGLGTEFTVCFPNFKI